MRMIYFLMIFLFFSDQAHAKLLATCTNIKGKVYALTGKSGWTNQRTPFKAIHFYKKNKTPLEIILIDEKSRKSLVEMGARLSVPHAARDYSWFIATATYKQVQSDNFQLIFDEKSKGRLIWTRIRLHIPPLDRSDTAVFIGQCTR